MLGKYLKIDGYQYPNPVSFDEAPDNREEVGESEAGSDLVVVKRLNKKNFNMTFQVSKFWKEKIIADCMKLNVTAEVDGVRYEGRLRQTGGSLEPDSVNTNGYWTVTVTFIQK